MRVGMRPQEIRRLRDKEAKGRVQHRQWPEKEQLRGRIGTKQDWRKRTEETELREAKRTQLYSTGKQNLIIGWKYDHKKKE